VIGAIYFFMQVSIYFKLSVSVKFFIFKKVENKKKWNNMYKLLLFMKNILYI